MVRAATVHHPEDWPDAESRVRLGFVLKPLSTAKVIMRHCSSFLLDKMPVSTLSMGYPEQF